MPVVDLFCGCGGLSRGFELAGFNIVAAYDRWQSTLTCYNANFEHNAHDLDLNNVDVAVAEIGQHHPDIIIGGPPCQEFSNAGKRTEGDRADLTFRFAQIVTRLLPQYFVMENVPQARSSQAFSRARELYRQNGYGLTEVVLDASRCGIPQRRNRFFCIGALGAPDNFLLDSIFREYTQEEISVQAYFEQNNIPLDVDAYYRHPTTYKRRAIFRVDEVAPTIRGVNRPKPDTYRHHEIDAVDEADMANIRHLTYRERAYIQTFPINFMFENLGLPSCDLEQMIGNAVPVGLAQFVAQRLQEYQEYIEEAGGDMARQDTFSVWLRNEKGYSDRSISDVFSRIRRAERILPHHKIDRYYIVDLEEQPAYQELTPTVKSQVKKAINLKIAFLRQLNRNE